MKDSAYKNSATYPLLMTFITILSEVLRLPPGLIILQNFIPFTQFDRATEHVEYCQFNDVHLVCRYFSVILTYFVKFKFHNYFYVIPFIHSQIYLQFNSYLSLGTSQYTLAPLENLYLLKNCIHLQLYYNYHVVLKCKLLNIVEKLCNIFLQGITTIALI